MQTKIVYHIRIRTVVEVGLISHLLFIIICIEDKGICIALNLHSKTFITYTYLLKGRKALVLNAAKNIGARVKYCSQWISVI